MFTEYSSHECTGNSLCEKDYLDKITVRYRDVRLRFNNLKVIFLQCSGELKDFIHTINWLVVEIDIFMFSVIEQIFAPCNAKDYALQGTSNC